MRTDDELRPWPGLVERDGERHLRVTRGLVLDKRTALIAGALLLVLFAIPDITTLSPGLQLTVIHQGLLFGLAAVGLNLLLRHTKLVSFGHAAFFGTGAYTTALLATRLDVTSMTLLVVASLLTAGIMAAIIGLLSVRHTGLYFSLLTLAFGQLLFAIAQGQSALGSSDGLPIRPGEAGRPLIFGLAFDAEAYAIVLFYVTILVLVVGLVVMWRIANSPFGAALDAIGQQRTRARFIGIPVRRYVWAAFIISGLYGGVAGSFFGMARQHIRPEQTLHFLRSGEILFMAIIGGFETLIGPLVGGVLLRFMQDVGRDVTPFFNALTGAVLLAVVFGFPRGLVGSLGADSRLWDGVDALREDPTVIVDWVVLGGRGLVRGVLVWIDDVAGVLGVR